MNAWEERIACRVVLGLCVLVGGSLFAKPAGAQVVAELVAPPAAEVPAPPADAKEDEEEEDEKGAAGANAAPGRRGAPGETPKPQAGFSVRKEDRKVLDKLADFRRHSEKKAWEQAFRAIGELSEMNLQGMLPAKDGLLVPSRQQVWRALAALPAEGKEAYRLFNDPKAKQLFEQAKSPDTTDEAAALRKIFDQHFVTSIGDQAADRLGDTLFEAGDFLSADAAWKAVLDFYPDTSLSKPKLRAKRCAALARAGRWEDFDRVAGELTRTAAGAAPETVTLGGRQVSAAEYVQSLRSLRSAQVSTRPATTQPASRPAEAFKEPTGPLKLPQSETPLWQASFVDKAVLERADQQLQNMGWDAMGGVFSSHVPPAATDGRRVYVNWIGIALALDARSGKLLWRSRKTSDVGENVQQFVFGGIDLNRYHLAVAADKVLITGVPFDQLNRGGQSAGYKLVCHNAESGAVIWSNKTGTAAAYSIASQPLVVGDTIYAAAQRTGQQEMHLLALELGSGKLLWNVTLGTPQSGQDYRGNNTSPGPTVAYHSGNVYVLTNNGALVAVDTAGRRVEWALTYDPPPLLTGYMMFGGYMPRQPVKTPGAIVIRGSTLYLKEQDGYALFAVDLGGPALKWRRPVDPSATIADIDDQYVYTIGEELSAIDLNARQMKWSTKVPVGTGALRVLHAGESFYVLSSRGVFEIRADTGDPGPRVFRTADKDALGGRLWRAPDRLISVSNQAVTAYPLPVP